MLGFLDILPVAGITVDLVPVAIEVKLAFIVLFILSAILPAAVWLGSSHFDFRFFSSVVISVFDPDFFVAVTNST